MSQSLRRRAAIGRALLIRLLFAASIALLLLEGSTARSSQAQAIIFLVYVPMLYAPGPTAGGGQATAPPRELTGVVGRAQPAGSR
jgi:hypothetical protein